MRELETERAALRVDVRGLDVERDQLRERLAEMQTQLHERLAEAERRMHEPVAEVQTARDEARTDRDRLLALVERMAAEAARPWWAQWFGKGRG